jgi:hypothetical protein
MFRKIFGMIMVLSIFVAQAQAASHNGLKAAFDELNYSLVVEWDQKDKDFYFAQMKKFTTTLKDLQAKGLTNAQLVEFVKSEVKDERVAKDLETAFSVISINKMSSEEASQYMVETMKRSYSNGASWNGTATLFLAAGLLLVVAAIAIGGGSDDDDDDDVVTGGGSVGGCQTYYYCDQTCYVDPFYGYSCYDYNCRYVCY